LVRDLMKISIRQLLELAHIVNYGLAFSRVNAMLDTAQREHFDAASKNILDMRDELTPYDSGILARIALYKQCNIDDEQDLYRTLKHMDSQADTLDVRPDDINIDKGWFILTAKEAITRYNERHAFFMLESEYEDDLIAALGEVGHKAFSASMHNILNTHLACGNADDAILLLKRKLIEYNDPYTRPLEPYMAKHNARFAAMHAMIKDMVKRSVQEPSPT
jgi:hypothetical protein